MQSSTSPGTFGTSTKHDNLDDLDHDSHLGPGTCHQPGLDASLSEALHAGKYQPPLLQHTINDIIGPTASLGRRMRVFCERYNITIGPITVGVERAEHVRGVFVLHVFTHSLRGLLRTEWGGLRTLALKEKRESDPGRWASNCWDLVRRTLEFAKKSGECTADVAQMDIKQLTSSFVLMNSVWW